MASVCPESAPSDNVSSVPDNVPASWPDTMSVGLPVSSRLVWQPATDSKLAKTSSIGCVGHSRRDRHRCFAYAEHAKRQLSHPPSPCRERSAAHAAPPQAASPQSGRCSNSDIQHPVCQTVAAEPAPVEVGVGLAWRRSLWQAREAAEGPNGTRQCRRSVDTDDALVVADQRHEPASLPLIERGRTACSAR